MAGGGSDILKGRNLKYLVAFVSANVVAFFGLVLGLLENWTLLSKMTLSSAAISVFIGGLAIVLNGLVSADVKAILVSWRLRHSLPGCRAFSCYMQGNPRIDPDVISERWGPLPEDPNAQNRLWYKIYRQHDQEASVKDAHQSYLLTRDLTALSVVFLLTFGPAAFVVAQDMLTAAYYVAALAALFLLASQAGRNYGGRLVTNVLAAASGR